MSVALTAPELWVVLKIDGADAQLPGATEPDREWEGPVLQWAASALIARALVEQREGKPSLHPLLGALLTVVRRAERSVAAFGGVRGQPIRPFVVSVRGRSAVTHETVSAGIHALTLYSDAAAAVERLEDFCAIRVPADKVAMPQEVTDSELASAAAMSDGWPVDRLAETLRSGGLPADLAREIGGALAEGGMVTTLMAFEGSSALPQSTFSVLAGSAGSWAIDDSPTPGSRLVGALSTAIFRKRAAALLSPRRSRG